MKKNTKIIFIVVYVVLILIIAISSVKLYNLTKNKKNNKTANIVVSVAKKDVANFSISINNLKKDDTTNYYIKVNNYKNGIVNKENVKYKLGFAVDDNVDLKLYKDKSNLLENNVTKDLVLKGKNKTDILYKLVIKAKNEVKNGKIDVIISSK